MFGKIKSAISGYQDRMEETRRLKQEDAERREVALAEKRAEEQRWKQQVLDGIRRGMPVLNISRERSVNFPFSLQVKEVPLYMLSNVGYMEQRIRRETVGRSAGTSVRVMKGVSVRAGASKGRVVERDEIVNRGFGILAVTNKHLYYAGERLFRVPFSKIVSVTPYSDAVEVVRDRASALSEYFKVLDGSFLCQVIEAAMNYNTEHAVSSKEMERVDDPDGVILGMTLGDGMNTIMISEMANNGVKDFS